MGCSTAVHTNFILKMLGRVDNLVYSGSFENSVKAVYLDFNTLLLCLRDKVQEAEVDAGTKVTLLAKLSPNFYLDNVF